MSDLIQIHTKSGKQYWRSLDALAHTAEFRQWVDREFQDSATDWMDSASRRTLLKLMAASFGLAGMTACRRPVEHILPLAKGVEGYIPGKPLNYATALSIAGAATGLIVECHESRPTKVEGNPRHPYSLGATSAYLQAEVLNLYDPDRARHPLQRGKKSSWAEFEKSVIGKLGDGSGVAVLTGRSSSPTLAAVKAEWQKAFPKSSWVEYESISFDNPRQGAAIAFGQPLEPLPRYDKANVVVALDCDFLGVDSPTILPTKQFSSRRRIHDAEKQTMSRLYVAEANHTLTGAMADHRLRTRVCNVGDLAAALAKELNVSGAELKVVGNQTDKVSRWVAAVAKELNANKGRSLVVAGPKQPPAVHALVALINQALGNNGETIVYSKPVVDATPQSAALSQLAADLKSGKITTLIMAGGNPAYTLPADIDFAAAVKKVAQTIALTADENETWNLAEWQLPEAHPFEVWSDMRAPDGTVSVAQPLIQSMYEGRSGLEVLALLARGKYTRSYALLQDYWKSQWPAAEADSRWRKALHEGFLPSSASEPVKVTADAKKVLAEVQDSLKPATSGIEVVFTADYSLYDGRYANNAWLQEAPDPMSKLVWDNAALLSAKTAKDLGVADGDILEISKDGRTIQMPAMVMPGHADDSISAPLGYGRSACGRVGQGVGHNAGGLRTLASFHVAAGVAVRKTGETYRLVTTQEHHTLTEPITGQHRDDIVKELTFADLKKSHGEEHGEGEEGHGLFPDFDYSKGNQWGMVIDLGACTGCNACVIACQSENNVPVVGKDQVSRGREMHWIRMDRYYAGGEDDPQVVWQPMACVQCERAPCESVCPVAATVHSPEGLNEMAYNRCVGTRYCSNNCPYKVRRFNFLNWNKDIPESRKMVFNPDVSVRMRGVMEKCNYCVQRIQEKKISAKAENHRPLKDGEIVTACQQVCPAEAITFGDINNPESRVTALRKLDRDYAVLGELAVKPRTTYLAKLRNPNPELA